ncbi:MAG: Wzz/FepE/Etk N-terminal domain-containing protein [Bacteroidia bacterium]
MSNKNTDEIDLRELVSNIISIVKRQKIIITSLLVLSLLVGIYQTIKAKPSYTSSCLITFFNKYEPNVESSVFSSSLEVCHGVASYVQSGDYNSLSQLISVSVNDVKPINSITVSDIVDDKKFKLSITSSSEIMSESIFIGIENAINNSEFIKKQNEIIRGNDSIIYAELVSQIVQIDSSLKHNKLNADAIDNIYEHRFSLIEKKQKIEESLTHKNTFNIAHATNNVASHPNKIKEFAKYFIAGLVFTLLVVIFLEFRKYIKNL